MRKLRLDLDGIRVESFRTSAEAAWRGTVRGNGGLDEAGAEGEIVDIAITPVRTVSPDYTCFDTCAATCETRCTCITFPGACGCE